MLILLLIFNGLLFVAQVCQASHSSIRVDNGYKGVVIALSPEITANSDSIQNHIISKTEQLIRETSKYLFDATDGALYFQEVSIIVPNSWSNIEITSNTPSIRYSDSDIIITEKDFVQSFTTQFAGCGEHALPIVLINPLSFGSGDQQLNDTAKLLVHEWAHYRYGVFNEFGFPSDPLYPSYYSIAGKESNEVLINSCADDHKWIYNKTEYYNNDNQMSCDMSTSNSTGMPTNPKCIPIPDPNENSFESSLMYSQSVAKVSKFCGSTSGSKQHQHNVNSPNKQNILCDGRDTWSVIKAHPDLNRKSRTKLIETTVNVLRDSNPRTLFAIQTSEEMLKLSRNNWVNFALKKFGQMNVPDSEVAIFTYNSGTPIEKHDWKTASEQMSTFYFVNSGTPQAINFEIILTKGKEYFTDKKDKKGGIFVILIGGKEIVNTNAEQFVKIAKEFRELNVKLNIVLLPIYNSLDDRKHSSELFKTVVSITGGQVFNIRETNSAKGSVSTANQIRKAFETTQTDSSGTLIKTFHTISEKSFNNLNNKSIEFEFKTDETLKDKELMVYFIQSVPNSDGNPVITNVKLTNPKGQVISGTKPLDSFGGYMIGNKITKNDGIGRWVLSADVKRADESLIAIAEFSEIPFVAKQTKAITAKCWLNTKVQYNPHSDQPIIAYVNINQDIGELVSEVIVELVVTYYEKGYNNYIGDKTIVMLDNGLGDPDITKGDGIYSQYIVDIPNVGYYTISAIIKDKTNEKVLVTKNFGSTSLPTTSRDRFCCGSQIEGKTTELDLMGDLSRVVECGSILVTDNVMIDNFPPNSVRDLRIESVDYYNRTVSLLWTSPGGDYTFGRVNEYKIRAFHGSENDPNLRHKIKTDFDSTSDASIEIISIDKTADSYGKEQRCQIRIVSEEGETYYLALKAYDSQKHGSVVSNIAMAYIKSNVQIKSTTASANDISKAPVEENGSKMAGLKWWEILSICIGCAVVLLLVIIIGICFVGKKRRKTEETDRMPTRRAPDPPRVSPDVEKNPSILDNNSLTHSVEKIPNIDINGFQTNNAYDSGSQHNLQPLNVNALSPVQSWDAKDLLSHWGRVQEAKQRHEPPPVMRIEEALDSGSSNRSQSYASSEDDNTAIYTNPNNWRYQDVTARPTYIPNGYSEPIYRTHEQMRSNTPSDTVPRYSTINRRPTQNVSQV